MSYEVNNPEIQALLKTVGESLQRVLPQGWIFTLFLLHPQASDTFYMSTAERESMIHVLREFLAKQEIARAGYGDSLPLHQINMTIEILSGIAFLQQSPMLRFESEILIDAANRMIERGGSFVKVLGDMYFRADGANQQKILSTWPAYFLEYAE